MSEDETGAMLRLLHEISAKLDQREGEFAMLNKSFGDWQRTTATGIGFAKHATIRNTAIEAELEALKRPVEALEGSLRPTGH